MRKKIIISGALCGLLCGFLFKSCVERGDKEPPKPKYDKCNMSLILIPDCDNGEEEEDLTPDTLDFRISDRGKNLIKKYESLSLKAYRLKGERANTIGYGHQIKKDDPAWLRKKCVGDKITESQAIALFNKDIDILVNPALSRIKDELIECGVDIGLFEQGFIDALGSLIFNCGEHGIKNTRFYRLLKSGNIDDAIAVVPNTKARLRGLKIRRLEEQSLMLD